MIRRRQSFKAGSRVGLEISSEAIRAVEITRQGRTVAIQRLGHAETPAGSVRGGRITDAVAVSGALRRLWEEVGFSSRRCGVAVPAGGLTHQILTLPPAPPREQRQIIQGELERFARLDADSSFGWMSLAPGGGPSGNTLVFLSDRELLAGYRQALGMAGLEVEAYEPDTIAALRALEMGQPRHDAAAVIHICQTCSEMAVLDAGHMRYYRRLDLGLAELTGASVSEGTAHGSEADDPELARFLSGHSGTDENEGGAEVDLEPLLLEIKRSLQYYGRAYTNRPQPQRVILLGDSPVIERLAGAIQAELVLEARYLHPLLQYSLAPDLEVEGTSGSAGAYSGALGVALRSVVDTPSALALPLKNLAEAQPLVRQAPRYLMSSLAGSTAAVLAALAAAMLLSARLTQAQDQLSRAEAALQAANNEHATAVANARQIRTETDRLRQQALPISRLLVNLSEMVPQTVGIANLEVKEDGSMALEGDAQAPSHVNGLLQRFFVDPRFRAPDLDSLEASADPGTVRFRVRTGLIGYGKGSKKAGSNS